MVDLRISRGVVSVGLMLVMAAGCASRHDDRRVTTAPLADDSGPANSGWMAVIDGKEVPAPAIPMGDDATVRRILDEGKNHSQVWDHLVYLTSTIGPRLTGSSAAYAGNTWCMRLYEQWGLTDVHLEQWGTVGVGFDRGPSTGKVYAKRNAPMGRRPRPSAATKTDAAKSEAAAGASETAKPEANGKGDTAKPAGAGDDAKVDATKAEEAKAAVPEKVEFDVLRDVTFTTLSWTAGTNGPVRGPIIKEPRTEEEYEAVKDKLKGAWVLMNAGQQRGFRGVLSDAYGMRGKAREKLEKGTEMKDLPLAERVGLSGAAGFLSASRNDLVITSGPPGWKDLEMEKLPTEVGVLITRGDYDAINSRLADGDTLEAEFDLKHEFIKGPVPTYNTVAEIKGSRWPDEVVVISGHLDSWDGPGAKGATDNGTGTVVTLEAARLLMAAHAKPWRTIRFINYTGEEQGLWGSKGYVEKHKAELGNFSAVFVDDGGTNSEGGLTVADSEVAMMAAATAPTNNQFYDETDKKWLNVNIKHGGEKIPTHHSSDHASFDDAGVPGFFWDEVGRADYDHGHHTQFDTIQYAIPRYLEQSATNAAIVAYRLACAPTLLPRAGVTYGSPERSLRPNQAPAVKAGESAGQQGTSPAPVDKPRQN